MSGFEFEYESEPRSETEIKSNRVVIYSKIKDTPFTMYGEVHNDIDNHFYEKLDLKDGFLMVEHSSLFPEVKEGEHHLFEKAKGSEWIYYTQSVAKNPLLCCIDSRLENGFLCAMDEMVLLKKIEKEEFDSVFWRLVMISYKAFLNSEDLFTTISKDYFNNCNIVIRRQINVLINLIKNKETTRSVIIIQKDIAAFLVDNLIRMSSISVDINCIKIISEALDKHPDKPIHLFAGLNHISRLYTLLNLKEVSFDETGRSKEYLECFGRFSLDYDEELENKILDLKEKTPC